MAYSLINIALDQNEKDKDILHGWIVTKANYQEFELSRKGIITYLEKFSKKDYKSLTHFIGVMGKFNPYTRFFDPIQVDDLTFLLLLPLIK